MYKTIIQIGDKRLLEVSKEVEIAEIKSKGFQDFLKDLTETLNEADDGLAISAPQIGENVRVFVVSPKMFDPEFMNGDRKTWDPKIKPLIAINPKIISLSDEKEIKEEGCLSIRGVFGPVERPVKVKISAVDENGKKFERGASGLLARVFQHEIDHLDGILFIDKAESLNDEEGNPVIVK